MQHSLFPREVSQLELPGADICYIAGFVEQQQQYYGTLISELNWQQDSIQIAGKPVPIPRLNAWYGDAQAHYSYSGIALAPRPWTATLLRLKGDVEAYLGVSFNSVLANYYRDGNDSVAWHADDEPELGSRPLIASLSLGAGRRFSLRGPGAQYQGKDWNGEQQTRHIDLAGGSLLVMAGDTQRYWRHQVAKTQRAVAGRINLTFRQIHSRLP